MNVVTHRLSVQCAKGSANDMIGGSPEASHKSLTLQIAAARGAWGVVANTSRMLQLNDGLKLAVALECQRNSASVDRRNKRKTCCADTAFDVDLIRIELHFTN